ncbi:MAG TPA: peptidoglycan DD-metalloendopeptidase family protein [Chthoniobacteraceae bacterium]|jgi:murein DD-endopeptidase MepM/ murein hydrolase activator NlpD
MRARSLFFTLLLSLFSGCSAPALDIILPTKNDALFTNEPENFYMYVNRYSGGVKTTPWEGGTYGFVRNARETPHGTIFTRFHGGIDIKPLERDAKGNPLDEILAISAGRVVHVNPRPGGSNYGRYVVIEHLWDGCPYYSLYAHLGEVAVEPGTEVAQGQKIAVMGYTGRGIDRERAHLHLEITLLLSEHFTTFYGHHWDPAPNVHGIYSGLNLTGVDVARLYLEARKNPKLTIPQFLAQEETFFHVSVPGTTSVDLLKRYPWMADDGTAEASGPPAGWRISFAQSGVPLRVKRLEEAVQTAYVTVEKPSPHPLQHVTCGIVAGSGTTGALTKAGQRLLALLTYDGQTVPATATIPGPMAMNSRTHTVKKGETLLAIANQHKTPVSALLVANKIKDPKLLQIGQVLVIPTGGAKGAAPDEPAAEGAAGE